MSAIEQEFDRELLGRAIGRVADATGKMAMISGVAGAAAGPHEASRSSRPVTALRLV